MHVTDRKFLTSTLVAVAGCKAVTFRAWRNRNGLFPDTKESGGWNHFSIVDICLVRAIVMMTNHGLPADDAIWFAQTTLRQDFKRILDGTSEQFYVAFFKGGVNRAEPVLIVKDDGHLDFREGADPDFVEPRCTFINCAGADKLADILARTKGIATVIDLMSIAEHVISELRELSPETILTGNKTLEFIATTLAGALRPSSSDEEADK